VGLLLTGDRVAASVAARVMADRLACAAGLAAPPSVSFGGVPFVPQAVTGRFTDVRVVAHDVHRGGIAVDTADAHLRGLSLPAGNRVTAAHVSIELTVGYAALPADLTGHPVRYRAVAGRLAVDTTVGMAGRSVPVTILVEARIDRNTLTLTPREVQVLGIRAPLDALPAGTGIGGDLSRPLPALPAGLRYRSLSATDRGLLVVVDGDNVSTTVDGTTIDGKCGGVR
jgi:hypothetical protein